VSTIARRRVAGRLAALALSLLVGVVVLEAAMRVIYSRRLDYQIEMSRYASTVKRPAADPRQTHEHTPGSSAQLMGVPVTINSLGYRDREIPLDKPPHTLRLVLVGDSLTFGWGVAAGSRFSEALQARLGAAPAARGGSARVEVINTGIGNYNTAQQLALFENNIRRLDPDIVVVNWFINDAEPTPTKRSPIAISYSYLAMWLWGRLDTLQRMEDAAKDYREHYGDLYDDDQPGFVEMRRAMARFGELAGSDGFEFVVALLPELHSVWPNYEFRAIHDKVAQAATSGGASLVIDLAPSFASETPASLWVSPDDAHPNDRGHAIIARGLFEPLRPVVERRLAALH
jgi:lysophospholipase L1-like esterase